MVKVSRWVLFITAICLLLTSWGSANAQSSDFEFFAQTGHFVKGDFLRYYRSALNPTLVFGYPLTEQFTSKDGKTVQYFQRARFEQTPSGIIQTPLGRKTYIPGKQIIVNNPLACKRFTDTGYSICYAFLEFYTDNGGVARFGYPISPFEIHNDQIVQYFEKTRFEWRPGEMEGQRIGITDLGRIYFDQLGEDPGFLKPSLQGVQRPKTILNVQVRAFPADAVTKSSDQQTIYVVVQDQNLQPVAGANGVATIRLPSGGTLPLHFEINDKGVGKLTFAYQNQPNGMLVNVDINVTYQDLAGKTITSFRIWY